MKAIICDIDGTLSDSRHRFHYVQAKDYDSFHGNLHIDDAVYGVAELLNCVEAACGILLCTGRPEQYREQTVQWLADKDIWYDKLYMRPDGDHRKDSIVKIEQIAQMKKDGFTPFLVIDDRQRVVDAWREAGLTCLQHEFQRGEINSTALLTLMVGPTGAGKSTWLAEMKTPKSQIIASDDIRADLCGDFKDQSKNDQVFEALHDLVKLRMRHNLPTFVDATNLKKRDRLAITSLVSSTTPIRYVVLNRSMEKKYKDGGWRNEIGFDLIAKHEATFESQKHGIITGDGLPNVTVWNWLPEFYLGKK